MNLRKLSQQTYFKQKPKHSLKCDSIQEEDIFPIQHKKNVSQHSTSPQIKQTSSQLFQKFKTYTTSTSPSQKYHMKIKDLASSVTQFTTEKSTQKSSEQREVVQRLLNWEKKRKQEIDKKQKQLLDKEQYTLQDKPKLTKETIKRCENGLKHHFQLNNFIKFRHQQVQCSNDLKALQKFEKLKKGVKILIEQELETDDNLDDDNNKSTQFQLLIPEQDQLDTSQVLQKEYRSKSDVSTLPIHLRFEYEIQFKQAKLQEKRNQKVQEQEVEMAKKYHSTAEQFEHFLSEQDNFLKRKQQFQAEQFKKELDKITEIESQNTYQPELNFPPLKKKENISQSKDGKFEEKINFFEEQRQKQKGFYFFRSTLPDVRKSITRKYKEVK